MTWIDEANGNGTNLLKACACVLALQELILEIVVLFCEPIKSFQHRDLSTNKHNGSVWHARLK